MTDIKGKMQSAGLLWLRVLMGSGIAYHGYGKIFQGRMDGFTQGVANMGFPMPEVFAWMAALSEFAGGVLIVTGLVTRPAALFVFSTMGVAAFVRHAPDPFKVKELAIAYWTIAGAILLTGPGCFSIDAWLKKRKEN